MLQTRESTETAELLQTWNASTLMSTDHLLDDSRERNRVHARNTRERKKSQMDGLQSRIQELVDEVGI